MVSNACCFLDALQAYKLATQQKPSAELEYDSLHVTSTRLQKRTLGIAVRLLLRRQQQ
jgi:hypothetical protein